MAVSNAKSPLNGVAAALASALRAHVPAGIAVAAQGSVVMVTSEQSSHIAGADLADFADDQGLSFAVERALDTVQDFVATEVASPWPPNSQRPKELAIPDAQTVDATLTASYTWSDGSRIVILEIPLQ